MTDGGEGRPLRGLRVLVPRPAGSGADLRTALAEAGASPVHVPLIEIRSAAASPAMARAVTSLAAGGYDWVAFTSAAAVSAVYDAADRLSLPAAIAPGTAVAAVGAATAEALRRAGFRVDLVPGGRGSAAALAAAWPSEPPGRRVLLPRSDRARPDLPDALRSAGYRVETVIAYRTVALPVPPDTARELAAGSFDAVLLTSPSTASALAAVALAPGTAVVAIGEPTARAASAAGITATATAARPDAAGMVAALTRAATGGPPTAAAPAGTAELGAPGAPAAAPHLAPPQPTGTVAAPQPAAPHRGPRHSSTTKGTMHHGISHR